MEIVGKICKEKIPPVNICSHKNHLPENRSVLLSGRCGRMDMHFVRDSDQIGISEQVPVHLGSGLTAFCNG